MSDFNAGLIVGAVLGVFGIVIFVAIICAIEEWKESHETPK